MDVNKDDINHIIQTYIRALENIDIYHAPRMLFDQVCYSKIAAINLLRYIQNDTSQNPITIIENYRRKMNQYSCVNSCTSMIFSIQYDATTYILDEIIVHEERRRFKN